MVCYVKIRKKLEIFFKTAYNEEMGGQNRMAQKTVCFSGHRPEKLPYGGDENSLSTNNLKSLLYKEIYDSIQDGYTDFVTGLARGVDNWAAQMVLEFKNKNAGLRLICVQPYKGYGENWKGFDRWNLAHILERADEVVVVCDEFRKDCMRLRNEYMVNRAEKLIAVVSNYRSGTGQTIRYAQKRGLLVRTIEIQQNREILC